ncbi:MAG: di-heme oxidoredictase family protein [Pseudomonadota bacterium]
MPLDDVHLNTVPRTEAERGRIAGVLAPPTEFSASERFEALPAGAATVRARTDDSAFSQPSNLLDHDAEFDFLIGGSLFDKIWVSSPASTRASDGLGPLFNARACQSCHFKNGAGRAPAGPEDDRSSLLLRVAVPGDATGEVAQIEAYLAAAPDPVYGGQIQDRAVLGQEVEAQVEISYEEIPVTLADGTVVSLRKPTYGVRKAAFGPLHPNAVLSPRVAPQMIGLGLLEAIPAEDILARSDPNDADGDGISGRPQIVWSSVHGRPMLGRFGLKAGQPTLLDQAASAFSADIGISTPFLTDPAGDCTAAQTACRAGPHGDGDVRVFEIDAEALGLVAFFSANLGVPARRDIDDPTVLRGKQAFHASGCTSCHTPKHVTARLEDRPEHSFQLIWPYTDLLLHDMGPGLADDLPEGQASGREWRTPPLWGLGLTAQVSGHTQFLHDGRARSLLEAILWHGGEAQAARDRVVEMPKAERDALIRFLESL